jgi:hypothetical protein
MLSFLFNSYFMIFISAQPRAADRPGARSGGC